MSAGSDLQVAVNRFASTVGFAPVAVDGKPGVNTFAATQRIWSYLSADLGDGSPSPLRDQAASLASNIASADALATNATYVAGWLTSVGDSLGLPGGGTGFAIGPSTVMPTGSGGGTVRPSTPNAPGCPQGDWNWADLTPAQQKACDAKGSVAAALNPSLPGGSGATASLFGLQVPKNALYVGGALAVVAIVVALTRKKSGSDLHGPGDQTNREGLTWEEWRNAARVADPTGLHPEKIKAWRKEWKRGVDPTEMGQ